MRVERVLAHPHNAEQPFTRSQSRILVSDDTVTALICAKRNVHGFSGHEVVVDLTTAMRERFEAFQ